LGGAAVLGIRPRRVRQPGVKKNDKKGKVGLPVGVVRRPEQRTGRNYIGREWEFKRHSTRGPLSEM